MLPMVRGDFLAGRMGWALGCGDGLVGRRDRWRDICLLRAATYRPKGYLEDNKVDVLDVACRRQRRLEALLCGVLGTLPWFVHMGQGRVASTTEY